MSEGRSGLDVDGCSQVNICDTDPTNRSQATTTHLTNLQQREPGNPNDPGFAAACEAISIAGVLVTFGMLGLLFVVPQYLQFLAGHDALGTGIRLLPLIGGLVVGAPAGERLARAGYRVPVAAGLAVLAAGAGIGAFTDLWSGYGFVAAWLATAGLGIGMALAPAMDAVLDALPTEQAGSGTAITMTLRQTGGALGVALLGSLLAQGYASRVNTAGLHGMTLVLVATAITAGISAPLTAAFLPNPPPA